MLDRETLAPVDEKLRAELAAAAKVYVEAPANLRAAIIRAAAPVLVPRPTIRRARWG